MEHGRLQAESRLHLEGARGATAQLYFCVGNMAIELFAPDFPRDSTSLKFVLVVA